MVKHAKTKPKHRTRLMIKNLPFTASEKSVRKIFRKFGEISEVNLPMDGKKPRNKGFAFLEFSSRNSSEKAIKDLNGSNVLGRQLSVDWAVNKTDYGSVQTRPDENTTNDEDTQEEVKTNPFEPKKKPKVQNKIYQGTTLFARNISYDTLDEDLYEYFGQFGDLRYAKVVYQKETNTHRGTAFICYKDKTEAEAVLEKFKGELGEEYELQGRVPNLVLAVGRDDVSKVTTKVAADKPDKRNLQLAKVGLLRPGTDEYQQLDKQSLEQRTRATKAKVEKLKNPNVFVSQTRVCIRNLGPDYDEKKVKALALRMCTDDPSANKTKILKQVKILKDTNQTSKGIVFLEFNQHEMAMKFVTEMNAQAASFTGKRKPMAEFSLEDHRMLRLRDLKSERYQKKAAEKPEGDDEGSAKKKKKKEGSRGKRQREKKRLAREKAEQEPDESDVSLPTKPPKPILKSQPDPQKKSKKEPQGTKLKWADQPSKPESSDSKTKSKASISDSKAKTNTSTTKKEKQSKRKSKSKEKIDVKVQEFDEEPKKAFVPDQAFDRKLEKYRAKMLKAFGRESFK